MSSLASQLKPLLASPGFLPWHGLGAVICLPALLYPISANAPVPGAWAFPLLVPLWSAGVLVSLQRDLVTPPFSFCLPRQQSALTRSLLLMAVMTGLLSALPTLAHPELGGGERALAMLSASCLGASVFLATAALCWRAHAAGILFGPLMVVGACLIEFESVRAWIEAQSLRSPLVNAVALAALFSWSWWRLENRNLARRLVGRPYLSIQRIWSRAALEENARQRRTVALRENRGGFRRRLEAWLFARIEQRPIRSAARNRAAAYYEVAGGLLPGSMWTVPWFVGFAAAVLMVGGYALAGESSVTLGRMLVVVTSFTALHLWLPRFESILLPLGRRECLRRAVQLSATYVVLLAILHVMLLGLAIALGAVLPTLPFDEPRPFRPLDPAELGLSWVPFAALPLSLTLQLRCRRWLLVPQILLFGTIAIGVIRGGSALLASGPVGAVVSLVLSWSLLIGVLRNQWLRRDLTTV